MVGQCLMSDLLLGQATCSQEQIKRKGEKEARREREKERERERKPGENARVLSLRGNQGRPPPPPPKKGPMAQQRPKGPCDPKPNTRTI